MILWAGVHPTRLTNDSWNKRQVDNGVITEFEIQTADSKFTSKKLYENIDWHMPDSTACNMAIASAVAQNWIEKSQQVDFYV